MTTTKRIEEDLVPGVHVRHKKQPDWGIGRVASVVHVGDARADVVVDFETVGTKKLRLAQDMFDWVSDDELQARADAEAAAKRAAKKQKAAATPQATALSPFQTVNGSFAGCCVNDGTVVAVEHGGAVHLYDKNGNGGVVGGAPGAGSDRWAVCGDVVIGTSHSGTSCVLVDLTTRKVKTWSPPLADQPLLGRVTSDGVGRFAVSGHHHLFVVDKAGQTLAVVPLPFIGAEQHLSDVAFVGDGFAGTVFGPSAAPAPFHVVGFGADGVERWRHAGHAVAAVDAGHVVFIGDHDATVVDAAGAVVARVADVHPNGGHNGEGPWVGLGDDIVCVAKEHVVRFAPLTGALRWRAATASAHRPPVVAGPVVASAAHMYGDHNKDVFFVDANDGRVIVVGSGAGTVSDVVAVDAGAFLLVSYTKKQVAWTQLHTPTPSRVTLTHDDKVFAAVSPAPGVVVTKTSERLSFWKL